MKSLSVARSGRGFRGRWWSRAPSLVEWICGGALLLSATLLVAITSPDLSAGGPTGADARARPARRHVPPPGDVGTSDEHAAALPSPSVNRGPTPAAIRALWVRAADLDDPREAIAWLEAVSRDARTGPALAALARFAQDDLEALQRLRADPFAQSREMEEAMSSAEAVIAEAERIAELAAALRYADDRAEIRRALRGLGGARGDAAADAILAAGRLPETSERRTSLRMLWRMAADDVDGTRSGEIRRAFADALDAVDAGEARIAALALADLDRLSEHDAVR